MPHLTPAAARAQIAQRRPAPVYLIVGDDDAEMSRLAGDLSALVEDGLRAFNVERIHGDKHVTFASIVQAARTLPMLGDRRVVVVLRAEKLLKSRRRKDATEPDDEEAAGAAGDVELLTEYVASPEPLTTLAVVTAEINRATRLYKAFQKHAAIVECWGLRDPTDRNVDLHRAAVKAHRIIGERLAAEPAPPEIDPRAAKLLVQRAGADVATLRGDLDRLLLYAAGRQTIGLEDAEAVVSAETSQNAWAVVNAIQRGDRGEALRQLALALDAGGAPEMILGQLGWMIRDPRSSYESRRIPAAVDALFRTDLDLKSSRGDRRVLLERLVLELCAR